VWLLSELPVTTPFGFIAFVVTLVALAYLKSLVQKRRLLQTLPTTKRARVLREGLKLFDVDTANLTAEQQYEIAITQIRARERRVSIKAAVLCFLSILLLIPPAILMWTSRDSAHPPDVKASSPKLAAPFANDLSGQTITQQPHLASQPPTALEASALKCNRSDTEGLEICVRKCYGHEHTLMCDVRFSNWTDHNRYFDFHRILYPTGARAYASTEQNTYPLESLLIDGNKITKIGNKDTPVLIPARSELSGTYVFNDVPQVVKRIELLQMFVLSRRDDDLTLDDGDKLELRDIAVKM
jgi:hypothetical protein